METAKNIAKEYVKKAYSCAYEKAEIEHSTLYEDQRKINYNKNGINVDLLLAQIFNYNRKDVEKGRSLKKDSDFVDYVKRNFPRSEEISRLMSDKQVTYDLLRKIIILMHFYVFFNKEKQKIDEIFDEYVTEINTILYNCGFGKIYLRNPYDWIFMHCAVEDNPIDEFQSIFYDMYLSKIVH
jgi:hypothetical protein